MSIHEDARKGTLVGDTLARYLRSNPNILDEQDPATGRAPLATAAVAGFADVVDQLLKRGAKAQALSRDGETALLLATRETSRNRPRIVQLLLSKTPESLVDATTTADKNRTPLMYAVLKKDIESIRLLVKAGASAVAPDDNGLTPETVAAADSDRAVRRALNPDERSGLAKMADLVGDFLLYIVAWVNKTADGVMNTLFGLNPKLNDNIDEEVNYGETPNKGDFLDNIDDFLARDENAALSRFFKDNPTFIQDLAKKATELSKDSSTPLGGPDLLPKMIKVTLHQQVIYCDDSSSMKREGRWAAQVQLVKRIARITTRVLPDGEGVALRFINQNVDNSDKLSLQGIANIVERLSWHPSGDTEIGTYLKSKILEPLIYSQLERRTLAKPYLISVITDGMPEPEKNATFVEAIKECGRKLQEAGYPRESVKFLVGQIGTGKAATTFLQGIGNDLDIKDMVYVTTDQLDERLSAFKENEGALDRWLLETLYKPIKG